MSTVLTPDTRIFVAGHKGLVGSAIYRRLTAEGLGGLITRDRNELDLRDSGAVNLFFERERPEIVFLAAARVGGILANAAYPAEFMYDNLAIQLNCIEAAHRQEVKKLLFLGSSCIYPKFASQPIRESELLGGHLEPTNEAYAVAKIAGVKMCQAYWTQYGKRFISVMPTNLYGPGDNFDLETSHVLPALIRKFHEAVQGGQDEVTIWGSGEVRREFLHVDDLADACLFLMDRWESPEIVNVGTGSDLLIMELAKLIGSIVGFEGRLVFDRTKPDGVPRKLLDSSRLRNLGWSPTTALEDGIRQTYDWFCQHTALPA
jgi:GDP-L-fucose synthase